MSKKNEQLAQLINTLSSSEKRYFRLHSNSDGNKHYLKLYELLSKPGVDDKTVAKKMGPQVNLSYERIYLQKMLLRALRNYHEDSSVEHLLYAGLMNVEILFSKGQYNTCKAELKKYLAVARENELFSVEIQLYQWYRWVLLRLNQYNSLTGTGRQLYRQEMDCFEKARNLAVLKDLKTQFVECMFAKDAAGRKNMLHLKKIMDHPLLKNEAQAKSFKGQVLYFEMHSWHYERKFELKQAYASYSSAVSLFEKNKGKIVQLPQIYTSFLSNFVGVCHGLKRYDEALTVLEKIERCGDLIKKHASKNNERYIREICLEKRLLIYLYSHRFDEGISLYTEHAKEIAAGGLQPASTVAVIYMAALCYLYKGNPEKSLKLLRSIIDEYDADTNKDILLLTHMAHVMVHFELKNYSLVRHLLLSLRRFAATKGFKQAAIPIFIKMFGKLTGGKEPQPKKQILRAYKEEFSKLKTPGDLTLMGNLDMPFWLSR